MASDYFHRVQRLSPTRFWINNPSLEDASWAIAMGARGCTNNPSYSHKMLRDPVDGARARAFLDEAIAESPDDDQAAAILQRKLVKGVQELFLPLWKESRGQDGYVSIQGDPVHEDDPGVILREARENRALGENIAVKIPCTKAGLEAMEELVAEGHPINATEIMSVSQGIALCEMYLAASRKGGKRLPLWLSFIAGIYDEHLENQAKERGIDIEGDILRQAGLAATRKMYAILHDRRYPATIIGGGARQLRHFTEMVGGDLVVTINRKGTAEELLGENPDVVHRFLNPVPPLVVDELLRKLPDFRKGWEVDGLGVEEFEHFGPVILFRSMFLESWRVVLAEIAARRRATRPAGR
jgi:transaldolase